MSDWLALGPQVSILQAGEPLFAVRIAQGELACLAAGVGSEPVLPDWRRSSCERSGDTVAARAETADGRARFERHVAVVAPELVLLVDDLTCETPVRWQWRLDLPARPILATHARRCDLMADAAGVRFYWLVPEGIRARLSDGEPECTLTLETTQPTREVRIAVAMLPWTGEPPLPERFRDGDRLGIRLAGVTAWCGSQVGDLPATVSSS